MSIDNLPLFGGDSLDHVRNHIKVGARPADLVFDPTTAC
jgi:hypothetical protein